MARQKELKWLLDLEERQRVADGAGGFDTTWAQLGQLWAHVEARGVSNTEVTGGDTSRIRYRITVRAAAEGAPERPKIGQRLRDGTRAFEVEAVHEADAAGLYLHIWANEEVLA